MRPSLGRGCFRLKMTSCCRRAAASNASLWRVTKKARMYVRTATASESIALIVVEQPSMASTSQPQSVDFVNRSGFDDPPPSDYDLCTDRRRSGRDSDLGVRHRACEGLFSEADAQGARISVGRH